MFRGTYTHNLDSAGRFVMPMSIRFNLGEKFIITKGLGCLCVFTEDWARQMESELDKLGGSPLALLLNPHVARLHRHFFSGMVESGTDKQFRVQLTPEHRSYAGIEEDVVICGCGKYVELWSPKSLEQYKNQNDRVEDLTSSWAALSLPAGSYLVGEGDAGVSQAGPA